MKCFSRKKFTRRGGLETRSPNRNTDATSRCFCVLRGENLTNQKSEWSEWDERHGRQRREGSGRVRREVPRYKSYIRYPVQKQERPVPNQRSGQAERLRNLSPQSEISNQISNLFASRSPARLCMSLQNATMKAILFRFTAVVISLVIVALFGEVTLRLCGPLPVEDEKYHFCRFDHELGWAPLENVTYAEKGILVHQNQFGLRAPDDI